MTEKSRTETFSDGVLAIAITLLVLDLRVYYCFQQLSTGQPRTTGP